MWLADNLEMEKVMKEKCGESGAYIGELHGCTGLFSYGGSLAIAVMDLLGVASQTSMLLITVS